MYVPNNRTSKHVKQNLVVLKGKTEQSRELEIPVPHSVQMIPTTRQKAGMDVDLSNTINQQAQTELPTQQQNTGFYLFCFQVSME
jgi:hypothetical protein